MNVKKILHVRRGLAFASAAALLFAASACLGDESSRADSAGVDSVAAVPDILSPAQTDSVAVLLGTLDGHDEALRMATETADGNPAQFDKNAYISGVRAALSDSCASESFTNGLAAAYDIILQIENLGTYGVEIDRNLLLSAIEKALMADSVSDAQLQQITSSYNSLLQRAYDSAR